MSCPCTRPRGRGVTATSHLQLQMQGRAGCQLQRFLNISENKDIFHQGLPFEIRTIIQQNKVRLRDFTRGIAGRCSPASNALQLFYSPGEGSVSPSSSPKKGEDERMEHWSELGSSVHKFGSVEAGPSRLAVGYNNRSGNEWLPPFPLPKARCK
jgi:hypothetical protein